MQLPRREDFSDYRAWQDANVEYVRRVQIAHKPEPTPAEDVDEWTWEPEPTADGLEDLL